MYQEIILEHYRRPLHAGLREPFDAQVQHINPTCGDEVTLRVTLKDAGDEPVLADVSYETLGCSISQASASVMADMIIGKTVGEAMDISEEFLKLMQSRGEAEPDEDMLGDAVAFEGVSKYPARIKCALLGWMAWKDATARALSERRESRARSTGSQMGSSYDGEQRGSGGRASDSGLWPRTGRSGGWRRRRRRPGDRGPARGDAGRSGP